MTHYGRLSALLALGLFLALGSFIDDVSAGEAFVVSWAWAPDLGAYLSFHLDGLSLLFSLLITGIGFFIHLYSGAYMAGHAHQNRLHLFLSLFMLSMLGLVLADNLLLLFVFWEMTSITSYLLIGFDHESEKSRKSALQALVVTGAGGLAMLAGFLLLGQAAGGYELSEMACDCERIKEGPYYLVMLVLILLGAFTKSAQFPFHFWLPNAMSAPTPVSAYLHSATMVKAGVYLLARLHPEIGGTVEWMTILKVVGGATAVFGSVMALIYYDLKRVLAYTTLMGLGVLVMFLGAETPAAIAAAMTFVLVHALYKSALFLVAGILDHQCGTRRLDEMGGLAWYMPITAAAAAAAAFSMAGFPPFLGFIGKELKYEGALALSTAPNLTAAAALTANALMTAAALTIAYQPFHSRFVETPKKPREAPLAMWIGPAVFAASGFLLGVAPSLTARTFIRPALTAFFGDAGDFDLKLYHGLNLPLALSAATLVVGGVIFWRRAWVRGKLQWLESRLPVTLNGLYNQGVDGLKNVALAHTQIIQKGSLRQYFFVVFSFFVLFAAAAIFSAGRPRWPAFAPAVDYPALAAAVLMAAAALRAATTDSRLTAVCSLGFIGASAALIFVLFGAPDVALTQLLVETLTLVIISFVLWRLPPLKRDPRPAWEKIAALTLSLAVGGLAAVLTLSTLSGDLDPKLTAYFAENSLKLAHGRNIVNVILVDFRALDTLGEIVVVAGAALSALILLRSGRRERRP